MSASTGAVFLSYASEDSDAAARIADTLKAAGIEVWFDRTALRGGDAWDRQIRLQIHDCRLFLAVVSARTEARVEGYFRREWKLAVDRTHDLSDRVAFLIPIVIDDTPEATADVPNAFRHVQWTRLRGGTTTPAFVSHVANLLNREPIATSGSSAFVSTVSPLRKRARSSVFVWPAIGLSSVIVLGGAYYLFATLHHRGAATLAQSATASAIPEKSIAVLPFVDMSEKKDQEYFADGLADELLNVLARVPGLRVIGRTSSFQFKGRTDDLRTIGAKLGCAHVVEGSVRRIGHDVRVTVQVIRTSDGAREWSATYDRRIDDVLQLQTEMALSIGRALQVTVADPIMPSTGSLGNPEAYDLYLRGLHAFDRSTNTGFQEAQAELSRAIDLDPSFLRAREMLGLTHQIIAANGWIAPGPGWEQVRRDAMDLLARDPRNGTAHLLLARFHTLYSWNWADAEREIDSAREVGDRGWATQYAAGDLAMALGQVSKAEQLMRAALAADPLSADTHYDLAMILIAQGRLADAELELRQCLAITPTYDGGNEGLGVIRLTQGRNAEALELFSRESSEGLRMTALPRALFALGRRLEAKAALDRAIAAHADDQAYNIAVAYAHIGDADRTFQWLNKALAEKSPSLMYFRVSDADFRKVASDPRYNATLRKMNLTQ